MSSQGSPTLDLDVGSRHIESVVVVLTLAFAILAPLLLRLAPLAQVGADRAWRYVIGGGFWWAGWWGERRILRIVWQSDGRWMLSSRSAAPVEVRLLPASRRGPGCVWLRWRERASAWRSTRKSGTGMEHVMPCFWARMTCRHLNGEGSVSADHRPRRSANRGAARRHRTWQCPRQRRETQGLPGIVFPMGCAQSSLLLVSRTHDRADWRR